MNNLVKSAAILISSVSLIACGQSPIVTDASLSAPEVKNTATTNISVPAYAFDDSTTLSNPVGVDVDEGGEDNTVDKCAETSARPKNNGKTQMCGGGGGGGEDGGWVPISRPCYISAGLCVPSTRR